MSIYPTVLQQTCKKWQALQALLEDFNEKNTRSVDIYYCKIYATMSRIQLIL